MPLREINPAHSSRGSSHRPDIGFREAHRFALAREQHDVTTTVSDRGSHQPIVFAELDGAKSNTALTGKLRDIGFLHRASRGNHENIMTGFIAIDR